MKGEKGKMTDEEIIEVVSALKANDKTMKDNGISDNLWGKAVECITFLQFENAELKSSLTHANEECLKWHERTQNLLKDSSGSISGYEKKISDLQDENATLRERLEKAVVFPYKMGSTVYKIHETDEEDKFNPWIDIGRIVSFSIDVNLWIYVRYNSGLTMWYTKEDFEKEVCLTIEAAEARLAELKGKNEK